MPQFLRFAVTNIYVNFIQAYNHSHPHPFKEQSVNENSVGLCIPETAMGTPIFAQDDGNLDYVTAIYE
jgi:hypothetical protein